MIDEPSARRPGFVDGPRVRLADGQSWSLPLREPVGLDPEYDALLALVLDAEDRAEGLRAELALTIFLLTRNYDLTPGSLDALLNIEPNDPALNELQRVVHQIACESIEWSRRARLARMGTPHAPSPTRSRSIETS